MRIGRAQFIIFAVVGIAVLLVSMMPASAARPGFGMLYYNGEVLRTIVPPAAIPGPGRDALYSVVNGALGQLGIAGVAPGDTNYHGGWWAVYTVTFTVDPYLLTSEQDVLDADAAGDVTVVRVPEADFRCPIQP
ncbi:MAG: hypothetical protein P8Y77_02675 [Nitrospirota bacterium]|jgi:hypothetical protein